MVTEKGEAFVGVLAAVEIMVVGLVPSYCIENCVAAVLVLPKASTAAPPPTSTVT